MKHKTFSFLLAMLMSMAANVASAHDFAVDGIYYKITSSTNLTVAVSYRGSSDDSYSNEYTGSVTIPESVTYNGKTYSVTSIGGGAFYDCTGLTSIEIPESVTSIGGGAFRGCTGLTSVTIPNSVTEIGYYAFENCSGLTSIEIPNSVTYIGWSAFQGCTGLTSVTIGNGVTSIGNYTFCYCTGLTSVTIGNGVTSIGEGAFYWCTGLTSVTIGKSVTEIGEAAFFSCSSMESIRVETDNTIYDSRENCNAIIETSSNTLIAGCKNSTIPNSVTSIGVFAFSGCIGLTAVTIPNSMTEIGGCAFYKCTGLTSIEIPNSVTSIGDYAFDGCTGLNFVFCNKEVPPTAYSNSFPVTVAIVPVEYEEAYQKATGWKNLLINKPFKLADITQSSITLVTFSGLTGQKAIFQEQEFRTVDNIIKITGLIPNTDYTIATTGYLGDHELNYDIQARTKTITVNKPTIAQSTNTSLTVEKPVCDVGDADVVYAGFDDYGEKDEVTLKGLRPGESRDFTYRVITRDGSEFSNYASLSTQRITASATVLYISASSATLQGQLSGLIDATVTSIGFEENNYASSKIKQTGLKPNTAYTKEFKATFKEGGEVSLNIAFTTEALTLETQQPKVITEGNIIVAAKSNLDDEEQDVGFQWRRQDWNDDFDSKEGGAYLYDGQMEGYIRSLNANYLWKFRPYYEANDGTRYYGEWKGMDPSDFSYFDPTVHTYAKIAVNGNVATVKGYAQRGTDNIVSQGFKYWQASAGVKGEAHYAPSVPSTAQTMEATGTVMEANLTGLDYETTYTYVAYVTTSEGETFYGEEQTFTTGGDPTGIESLPATESAEKTEATEVYDLSGRRLPKMQRGINIVRYPDGKVRKVMVK